MPSETTDEEVGIRRRTWVLIAVAGLVALGIRLLRVLTITGKQDLVGDSLLFYYWPAVQLARGHGLLSSATLLYGYPVPEAAHPPGFIGFLAALYRLGLHFPKEMMIVLCFLGAATVMILGITFAKAVSSRVGVISAGLAAVNPFFWLNDTLLIAESLFMFALACAFAGIYAFHRRPTLPRIVGASAAIMLAASTRPEMLALFPFVVVQLVLARRSLPIRKRVITLGVAAIIPLALMGAWAGYNAGRFERPVLTTTGSGQTLLAGNCEATYSGPLMGKYSPACLEKRNADRGGWPSAPAPTPKAGQRTALYLLDFAAQVKSRRAVPDPPFPLDRKVPSGVRIDDQSIDNEVYTDEAMAYIRAHPAQAVKTALVRVARVASVWAPNDQNAWDAFERRASVGTIAVSQWIFRVFAVLGIVGAVLWRKKNIPLYPIGVVVAVSTLTVAATIGLTRYRVAIDVCLVPLAATALDGIWTKFAKCRIGDTQRL